LQAGVYAAKLSPEMAKVVVAMAQNLAVPNLVFNQEETEARREAARNSIQARPISLVKGQVIIRDGDPITQEDLNILQAMESWRQNVDVFQVLVGLSVFILVVLMAMFLYAKRHFLRFLSRPRDLLAMSVLLIGLLGLAKFAVAGGEGLVGDRTCLSSCMLSRSLAVPCSCGFSSALRPLLCSPLFWPRWAVLCSTKI